ncbi:MAG: beta-galactosidase [Planctomycetota bacterium]
MADVTYDSRSFLIDGSRVWLVSGSLHYFRVPHELWRDRLIKARRAGLNCISTYVPWNIHEPREGEWDFQGDRDIASFIKLAADVGLYVILRPGPYICAEWDFGGLPAWLTAKSGMHVRTPSAAYTHYYDKYLNNVLGPLAELQVPQGGNIILIQNENEYFQTTMPDRLNYLEFISQLIRRAGFEIPIITCNNATEPQVPDTIDCVNSWRDVPGRLKLLYELQPGAPMLVTEFWNGWFDCWGGEHQTRDATETARKAMEILGCGTQYNYYMWHGGTNFGFYGARLIAHSAAWQTTSYDYDAPLAEGGGLTEKYYRTRLVNLLANYMGKYFATTEMADAGATAVNTPGVLNAAGDEGRWAVVTNRGCEEIKTSLLSLSDARHVEVTLEPLGAAAIPMDVPLTGKHTLNYTNCSPLGFFEEKLLVLHAPSGWDATCSINGKPVTLTVPAGEVPEIVEHQGLVIAAIDSESAQRLWVTDEALVIGPDFIGESMEDIVPPTRGETFTLLDWAGNVSEKKYAAAKSKRPPAPRLGKWSRVAACPEPVGDVDEWTRMDRPRDVDRLGVHYGYCWYRVEFEQDRAKKRKLLFPELEDRAGVFLNGHFVGTWGRGEDATREPISVSLKKGRNDLVLLADNLGRMCYGPKVGEQKGLFGHIWDAKEITRKRFRMGTQETFSKRIVPRTMSHLLEKLEQLPLSTAELDINLKKLCPVHLSFDNLPNDIAVFCNDRLMGFYPAMKTNWADVSLAGGLKQGKNTLKLLIWDRIDSKELSKAVKLYELHEPISGGAELSWRPWELPSGDEPRPDGVTDRPAWFSCRFKYAPSDRPLFLELGGVKKGQLYLNGHDLGRFWTIGPQEAWYLPEPWLEEENELLLFEELGRFPQACKLRFRPAGPYHD